ncbi:MAG: hypothetical protein PXX77_10395 [Gallionella sp.]|nr:hypothetical protein [Gallionella sp.]
MRIARLMFTTMLLTLLSGYSLAVQAADDIKVTSIAEIEIVTVGKDGKKTFKRTPPGKAIPGTEVIFTNIFENVGKKAASNIVIDNPIPENTFFKADSAMGKDTVITFSADGGKTLGLPEKIKLKGSDGKLRIAQPNEYTHIRWTYKGQLAPGKSSEVSFRAVIK